MTRASATPRLALAAVLLCSLAAIGACGPASVANLDVARVGRAIARSILSQRGLRTSVSCPAVVPRIAGQAFVCHAHLDVGSYPVKVVETDAGGHVRFGNTRPLTVLDVGQLERAIDYSILHQRGLLAHAVCPREVLERRGLTFSCAATVDRRRYPFDVSEVDGAGHVRYVGR